MKTWTEDMGDWERERTHLVKRMTTFWYNMGLFSGKSKAEAQGFKTYRTFLFVVDMFMGRYDRYRSRRHCSVWMGAVVVGSGGGVGNGISGTERIRRQRVGWFALENRLKTSQGRTLRLW
jgi:hypothetical protein